MKKYMYLLCALAAMVLIGIPDLDARGGRGGGGGGRGGGGRGGGGGMRGGGGGVNRGGGGRTMQRSPSMSRASVARPTTRETPRVARGGAGRPETRPSTSPGRRQDLGQKSAFQTPTRNDVQNFLQNRPSGGVAQRPSQDIGQRAGDLRNRQGLDQSVRDNIAKDRPNAGNWFHGDFWDHHDYHPSYYKEGTNWWGAATAVGVGSWLGWRANPYYYSGGYVDGSYYWGPQEETTTTEGTTTTPQQAPTSTPSYGQQSQAIQTTTTQQGTSQEWLPLGVFALTKQGAEAATPNIYMQLALNKDGVIGGTIYNSTTDQTYEAQGIVDQQSQRAAWKIASSQNSPIVETGIYNLTQSDAPVQINFADGRTQQMTLVRLEQPAK